MSADDFPDHAQRAEARQARYARDMAVLVASGIAYEKRNAGNHIIATYAGRAFDYWPSTGKLHERRKGAPYEQGGIAKLLRRFGFEETTIKALQDGHALPPGLQPVAKPDEQPAPLSDDMPPIVWCARISRFSVCVYRSAGFVVTGAPSEWSNDTRDMWGPALGGGFRKRSYDTSHRTRTRTRGKS